MSNTSFKRLKCHPKIMKDKKKRNKTLKTHDCLDKEIILLLKDKWNLQHQDDQIQSKQISVIRKQIKKKMSSCNNEICLLDGIIHDDKEKEKIKGKYFSPMAPKSWYINKNQWLNSSDIIGVMKQYMQTYDDFKFLGPSPIDFEHVSSNYEQCVWPEICSFDLCNYKDSKIKKFGFIFNTDTHDKTGSHWISMFLDLNKNKVFFFDSNGNEMPDEIDKLIKKLKKQGKKCGITLKSDSNMGIRHQTKNTECGIYSLYFIVSILEGAHDFDHFKKSTKELSDDFIEQFRNVYFNKI